MAPSSAAVAGAHTAKLTEKGEQPSLFDVLAQESLTTSLRPAAKFTLKLLARLNPERWAKWSQHSDELYLAFDAILQNHYLKNYGASFSENFYGMKRVMMIGATAPSDGAAKIRQLLLLVVWPYIREKLDAQHLILSEALQYMRPRQDESLKTRLSRIFVKLWPYLKSALGALCFIMQITYATSRTTTHSPTQYLSGTRLERLTPQDLAAFADQPLHHGAGALSRIWRFLVSLPGVFSRLFGYSLFLLQFVDMFYNSDLGSQLTKSFNTTPKAPHGMLREDEVLTLEATKCPICLGKRVNDTALSVSGYVFCFTCIDGYIKKEGKCPVTQLPASTSSLVRIFSATS